MLRNFLSENFRLKTDQLFEGLPVEEQDSLMGSGGTHEYRKGEIIFREGSIPTGIFGYHALLGEEYYMDSAATSKIP